MFKGDKINLTEKRSVLHVALRMAKEQTLETNEGDVVIGVHMILDQIRAFTEKVRLGTIKGHTGKKLTNVVSIGIGGSFLGPEFVYEAFK